MADHAVWRGDGRRGGGNHERETERVFEERYGIDLALYVPELGGFRVIDRQRGYVGLVSGRSR